MLSSVEAPVLDRIQNGYQGAATKQLIEKLPHWKFDFVGLFVYHLASS